MIEKLVKFIYKPQMLIISLNFLHKLLNCFSVSKIIKKNGQMILEPRLRAHNCSRAQQGPIFKGLQGGFIGLMGCIYFYFYFFWKEEGAYINIHIKENTGHKLFVNRHGDSVYCASSFLKQRTNSERNSVSHQQPN